ncbi:MAG TPA: peptidase S8, partial [Actinospica sp.]|nr:peptidase S8 [Actinospica sp.]
MRPTEPTHRQTRFPRRLIATTASFALALLGLGVGLAAPAEAAGTTAGGLLPFGCNAATSPGVMHCLGYTAKSTRGSSSRARFQTTGSSTGSGYTPSQLRSAYKLTTTGSSTETVAIVDAYNDPNAAADLAVYRSAYGLPACTAASGCFKQESQTGSTTSLPSTDYGWAEEESLDLDMVSAICQSCHILLVEAASANESDLDAAEN